MNENAAQQNASNSDTLLDDNKKNQNTLILGKLLYNIFYGFCPPSSSYDQFLQDDDNDEHDDDNHASSEEIQHLVLCTEVTATANSLSSHSRCTDLYLQAGDSMETQSNEEQIIKSSVGKMILKSSIYLYLITVISYYHFGVESILDLAVVAISSSLATLRKIVDPYASSILIAQLFLLPLLLLFTIMMPTNKGRDQERSGHGNNSNQGGLSSVSSTKPKKVSKRGGLFKCCQKDVDSQVVTSKSQSTPHPNSDMFRDNNSKIDEINLDLDEATQNLPPVETWKYRPVFIQPAGDTKCPGQDPNASLPIGTPFEFESSLFKGKVLFRLRNGINDNSDSAKAYFDASKYKLQRQLVIQGQFKYRTKMSDVLLGDIFDKKFKYSPPPTIARFISRLFNRLAPGIIIDMTSDTPKVLAMMGSGSHTISIDEPGHEPDIMAPELPEKTPISNNIKSSEHRKKVLGKPETASEYEFDPNLVYTFHNCDEVLDLAEYQFRIPILTMDFTRVLGDGQPMSIRAVHGDSPRSYFFFRVWHERTLIKAMEAKNSKG